jgi:hypothetical protein
MDILLRPKDIRTSLMLLDDMDHVFSDPADLSEGGWLDGLIGSETQHHVSLTRQVGEVRVDQELHYSLRSDIGLNVSSDEVVNRSSEKLLVEELIGGLELHDQLL